MKPGRTVILATVLAGAGCVSASSETTEPEWQVTGPHVEMVENAETVLAGSPRPDDGWKVGVVLAEAGEGYDVVWAVTPAAGEMSTLGPSMNCGGRGIEDDLWVMIDPGDLIVWSTEGDDLVVCADEIRVEIKAATQRVNR